MIDRQRVKLFLKLFENLGNHSQGIQKVEMINESLFKAQYSKPNFKNNVSQNFYNIYNIQGQKLNKSPMPDGTLYQSQNQLNFKCPYHASLLEVPDKKINKNKQIIQVFKNGDQIYQQLQVDSIHGSVLNRDVVGKAFIWNKKGTKFLYIANPTEKNGKHFMETDFNEDKDLEEALLYNKYQQDFGEQMKDMINPQIYEYDIVKNQLVKIKVPENVLPCFPQYIDEDGTKLIFQGYKIHKEFKYGVIHCFNRESDVYLLDDIKYEQLYPKPEKKDEDKSEKKDEQEEQLQYKIISTDRVSTHPRVSPDLSKILYFSSPLKPPHLNYLGIKTIDTSSLEVNEVLDYSQEYKKGEYMGVCGFYDSLQDSQWIRDSKHYIFACIQEGQQVLYMVNVDSKQVQKITDSEMQTDVYNLLDYDWENNILFAQHQNPTQPSILKYLPLSEEIDLENLNKQWQSIDNYKDSQDNIFNQLKELLKDNLEEQILEIDGDVQASFWTIRDFENLKNKQNIPQILLDIWENNEDLNPLKQKPRDRPLVVNIHGGPHAAALGHFSTLRLVQLLCGYSLLCPNYTGSAGYGMDFIERLQQNIGELDKSEILKFIDLVVEKQLCDPKKIITMGGSYGGYMSGIFASRHPDIFKCGILLNPVLNLAFNLHITDIPEWQLSTVFGREMSYNLTGEDYAKLLEHSPNRDPAQIPILQILGKEDRRVPYQQGLQYQAQAIAHGTEVETYIYPQSNHSLSDSLHTQIDYMLKICIFIEKQLLKE